MGFSVRYPLLQTEALLYPDYSSMAHEISSEDLTHYTREYTLWDKLTNRHILQKSKCPAMV